MNREEPNIRAMLIIRALIGPTDVIPVYAGPGQFPRTQELRGPIGWHRYNVWRDALGTEIYDEDAGLAALKLTEEERATVTAQCAFIREHTKPLPIWKLPENPLLPSWLADRAEPETAYDVSADVRRPRATCYDRNWNTIQSQQVLDDLSDCTIRTAAKARPEWWGYATTKPTRPHLTSQ